ncbi:MAG: hypothetical protein M1818_006456 [Claussenomyces sp. TS43310]|nr:MAG: hypothetical protein M1818_006456 [Claussenomyces sp. TS43310]
MAAEARGARMLGEVKTGSLEDLLGHLRRLHRDCEPELKTRRLGIRDLDEIWARHGDKLEITGCENGLPLLYHIVSTIVSPPRSGTVVVVDVDGRFDITRLTCAYGDLKHVHVLRPSKSSLKVTMESVEHYMLYGGRQGKHVSADREWVGTIVYGGIGSNITGGWRGWLKVESEREDVVGFGLGMSVEEAVVDRDARQTALMQRGWRATSAWGTYTWAED